MKREGRSNNTPKVPDGQSPKEELTLNKNEKCAVEPLERGGDNNYIASYRKKGRGVTGRDFIIFQDNGSTTPPTGVFLRDKQREYDSLANLSAFVTFSGRSEIYRNIQLVEYHSQTDFNLSTVYSLYNDRLWHVHILLARFKLPPLQNTTLTSSPDRWRFLGFLRNHQLVGVWLVLQLGDDIVELLRGLLVGEMEQEKSRWCPPQFGGPWLPGTPGGVGPAVTQRVAVLLRSHSETSKTSLAKFDGKSCSLKSVQTSQLFLFDTLPCCRPTQTDLGYEEVSTRHATLDKHIPVL
ncbi:hypothetical protein J6590_056099 [Homalodisca vitripennis]|nr:hypothetical protein J6590_056099 [Homalodisca vitripennis]